MERVADRFGTSIMENDKGKYRTEYAATLKGEGAVAFMADIKPMMGNRRQAAISEATSRFLPPKRKLDFDVAEEIRRRHTTGESVSSLSRSYGVTRQTIHPILRGKIYRAPPPRPWRSSVPAAPEVKPPAGMSLVEFHWLAGWLEGEGSFMAPPPSDPRRPRISAQARDRDVVTEAGRLLQIEPVLEGPRKPQWSRIWRVLLRGHRAAVSMLALEPLMSSRRRGQIQNAIAATIKATTYEAPKSRSHECNRS